MGKTKFVDKFENYREREGTEQIEESVTKQDSAEDCDIYKCIEKYGIATLARQSMANEPLYLDNTNRNMTLDEAVRMRKEMDKYFADQPANVRKVFGDSNEVFYQKYKAGEFNEFLETGVLTEQQINNLKGVKNEKVEKNIVGDKTIPTDDFKGDMGHDEGNN